MLKKKAHQKLFTAKPFSNLSTSKIISALITSRNKPSVIMVIGMVRNTSIGFTIAFTMPKMMATNIEEPKLETFTPLNILVVKKTAMADKINLMMNSVRSIVVFL